MCSESNMCSVIYKDSKKKHLLGTRACSAYGSRAVAVPVLFLEVVQRGYRENISPHDTLGQNKVRIRRGLAPVLRTRELCKGGTNKWLNCIIFITVNNTF
jgi:hypothetical protein